MTNDTTPQKRPRGRPRKKRNLPIDRPRQTQCLLCDPPTVLNGDVSSHLKTHGYSVEQYQRVFGVQLHTSPHDPSLTTTQQLQHDPQAPQTLGQRPTATGMPQHTLDALIDHMIRDPVFLGKLSSDVSQALISGPQRDLLSQSLTMLLVTRMGLVSHATAQLQALNGELSQPWRLEQGGEGHGPTPTRDLLAMHQAAQGELRDAENLLVRAVKLALEEQKVRREDPRATSPLDRFRGDSELLDGAKGLSPVERENVRQLVGMIIDGAKAKQELAAIDSGTIKPATVTVRDSSTAPQSDAPATPAPAQKDASAGPSILEPPSTGPQAPTSTPGIDDF